MSILTVRRLPTWLGTIRQEVAPRTAERYAEIVNNSVAPRLGNLPLTKLAPVRMRCWRPARRQGCGLSPRTRRHIRRILYAALGPAVEQQVVARNACDVFRERLPKSSAAR